jgi:hypothetical protein
VPAGGKASDRVNWSSAESSLLLPPGTFDVYWLQDGHPLRQPFLLVRGLELKAGQVSEVRADAGVRLRLADWVKKSEGGWWGAVPAGAQPEAKVNWSSPESSLLLPPGTYDVYWLQDGHPLRRPFLLVESVVVESPRVTEVTAASGIVARADDPAETGEYQVVTAGTSPTQPLHWARVGEPLLLPPATYDIVRDRSVVWKAGVEVPAEALVEVKLPPRSQPPGAPTSGGVGTGR